MSKIHSAFVRTIDIKIQKKFAVIRKWFVEEEYYFEISLP